MKPLDDKEFDRIWRVVDMLLTSHAVLRDRFRFRQTALNLLVIGLSIVATMLTFWSPEGPIAIGAWAFAPPLILGTITGLIFLLALAGLVLGLERRSWAHEHAVRRLGQVKAQLRAAKTAAVESLSDDEGTALRSFYESVTAEIVEIPESQFLDLKANHYKKVAVSRLIDTHPGAPVWYLRMLATLHGLREQETKKQSAASPKADAPVEEAPE